MVRTALTGLFLFLFSGFVTAQQEKIERFNSLITVDSSGLVVITEQIDVQVAGKIFKRGIVRDLPLKRKSNNGGTYRVDYQIDEVKANGKPSPWHTEKKSGLLRIYVGQSDVYLDPGIYHYSITYSTANQIGFFNGFDEFYWNVNGNGWNVPMDIVEATIQLPERTKIISNQCFTGSHGSTESDCNFDQSGDNKIHFQASNLGKREGLTVVTTFEPGSIVNMEAKRQEVNPVKPPSPMQRSIPWIVSIFTTLLLLGYYFLTWRKFGVDPPKPTVFPQFEAPNQLSPASVGMMNSQFYSPQLLTAAIVNLAVKGFLKIEEYKKSTLLGLSNKKIFSLIKMKEASSELPAEESLLMDEFFPYETTEVVIDGKYNKAIGKTVRNFHTNVSKQWSWLIIKGLHVKFWILPVIVLISWGILISFLSKKLALFSTSFIQLIALFIILNIILLLIYIYLIRRPSKEKLALRSDIRGFEMYLKAAEEKQLQHFNPPTMTPDIFEKNLPYAIALGAEKIWGKKFQHIMDLMKNSPETRGYHPIWYAGNISNISHFSSSFNSTFTNSMTSTATNPSSGSGGGGFSGGGGGGGGGGGW